MAACKYSDGDFTCGKEVNAPHDNEYCIFHSPKDKKGISGEEFNRLISEQIAKKDYNFGGYIFPKSIDFSKLSKNKDFDEDVDFSYAIFEGEVGDFCASFGGVIFKKGALFFRAQFKGPADFRTVQFSKDVVDFSKTQFNGYAYFEGVQFRGITNFVEAQFKENTNFEGAKFFITSNFSEAQFWGNASFGKAHFNKNVNFIETQFSQFADFMETEFIGNASFRKAHFIGDAYFINFSIKNTMTFIDTQFPDKTRFVLENPHFLFEENQSKELSQKIIFERIKFIPHLTFFENIKADSYDIKTHLPFGLILFRYCNLTDVYFTKNNLSMISFYKSQFDGARFYSNFWNEKREHFAGFLHKITYRRKYVICDELLYEYVRSLKDNKLAEKFREEFKIDDLDSYTEIASLYGSFKNALDTIKNYSESGWFYFNEIEMKRRALREQFTKTGKRWRGTLREWGVFLFYSLYKILMGYGEKPSWSFLWLIIFIGIFSLINLFDGLKVDYGITINYDWAWNLPNLISLLQDLGTSIAFSISRILPVNYIPKQWTGISYDGWGIVPFANTLILILIIIFIGIGIKRHFRRF